MTKEEQIKKILNDKVNPILSEHYGGAELAEYSEGVAWIKMTGACGGCPSSQETIENVVATILMEAMPEIEDVRLDNTVSSDLLDMARKFLNHEIPQ